MDSLDIIQLFHQKGINLRYLGTVAQLSSLKYIKNLLSAEMVARCCKKIFMQIVAEELDKTTSVSKVYMEKSRKGSILASIKN